MADYQTPGIAGTFQVEDLMRDAASCSTVYYSDSELKDEIRAIGSATARVGTLGETGGAFGV